MDRIEAEIEDAEDDPEVLEALLARLRDEHPDQWPRIERRLRAIERDERAADEIFGGGRNVEDEPKYLGEFKIIKIIARGGMGAIYEAVQTSTGRRVALKMIRRKWAGKPEVRDRFRFEIVSLSQFHHTNIVSILSADPSPNPSYFAMLYIPGASFDEILDRARRWARIAASGPKIGKPLPAIETLAAMSDVELYIQKDKAQALETGPQPPVVLSEAYLRSLALAMKAVSDAIEHMHASGVYHRDLKPRNLMVEVNGHCWLIDLGLAKRIQTQNRSAAPVAADVAIAAEAAALEGLEFEFANRPCSDHGSSPAPGISTTKGVGAPAYMAPEAFKEPGAAPNVDLDPATAAREVSQISGALRRVDVYGLGIVLYEGLTLRHAYPKEGCWETVPGSPSVRRLRPLVRPSKLARKVPVDLEAICLKAMNPDPQKRYPTAAEFSQDLQRWLDHEPVQARPARVSRRVRLWARRNPGWAIACALLLVAAMGWIGFLTHTVASNERERQVQSVQSLIDNNHVIGWRREVQERLRRFKSAPSVGNSLPFVGASDRFEVQGLATLSMEGWDAECAFEEDRFGATSLAFDRKGERLLIGTTTNSPSVKYMFSERSLHPIGAEGVNKIWDFRTRTLSDLRFGGAGPVAFRDGETPVQVTLTPDLKNVRVLDLGSPAEIVLAPPEGMTLEPFTTNSDLGEMNLAVSEDAHLIASPARRADGGAVLLVWDATTQRLIAQLEADPLGIAFSADKALIAAGDASGRVQVWTLRDGKRVAELKGKARQAVALAFGRNPRWQPRQEGQPVDPDPLARWFLVAGHFGGEIVVWDLDLKLPRFSRSDFTFEIFGIRVSPDGAMFAVANRGFVMLWDSFQGAMVLKVNYKTTTNFVLGLAFAPDGRRLAESGYDPFAGESVFAQGVHVFELNPGLACQPFSGLSARASKMAWSSDGSSMVVLATDWRIGVWDWKTGRMRAEIEAPPGFYSDNSAVALDAEGRRLAFSSGRQVRIYDLETRRERGWTLPEGYDDALLFTNDGRLLSVRCECVDPSLKVFAKPSPPRIVRVRDFLRTDPLTPIEEISDFGRKTRGILFSPDGRTLLIQGLSASDGNEQFIAYETAAWKRRWRLPTTFLKDAGLESSPFYFDPSGALVALQSIARDPTGPAPLITDIREAATGDLVRVVMGEEVRGISKDAAILIHPGPRRASASPQDNRLLRNELFIEDAITSEIIAVMPGYFSKEHGIFAPDNRTLMLSMPDGRINAWDIKRLQSEYRRLGF